MLGREFALPRSWKSGLGACKYHYPKETCLAVQNFQVFNENQPVNASGIFWLALEQPSPPLLPWGWSF